MFKYGLFFSKCIIVHSFILKWQLTHFDIEFSWYWDSHDAHISINFDFCHLAVNWLPFEPSYSLAMFSRNLFICINCLYFQTFCLVFIFISHLFQLCSLSVFFFDFFIGVVFVFVSLAHFPFVVYIPFTHCAC